MRGALACPAGAGEDASSALKGRRQGGQPFARDGRAGHHVHPAPGHLLAQPGRQGVQVDLVDHEHDAHLASLGGDKVAIDQPRADRRAADRDHDRQQVHVRDDDLLEGLVVVEPVSFVASGLGAG
ncbi:MAG: hypothetical protein NT031_08540, partial [Planctomycetota bacterium]|nr:hypothetical protein [Planctomycetota bacterium]